MGLGLDRERLASQNLDRALNFVPIQTSNRQLHSLGLELPDRIERELHGYYTLRAIAP
jgi:hypothetical protein